jgi:hypothetical protein
VSERGAESTSFHLLPDGLKRLALRASTAPLEPSALSCLIHPSSDPHQGLCHAPARLQKKVRRIELMCESTMRCMPRLQRSQGACTCSALIGLVAATATGSVKGAERAMQKHLRLQGVHMVSLLALVTLVGGCVLPLVPESPNEVPERSITNIRPNVFARADVFVLLGNPTRLGEEDDYFLYEWEREDGGVALGFPLPFAMAYGKSCHQLVIRFAPNGLVSRVRVFHGESQLGGGVFGDRSAGACVRDKALRTQVEAWLAEAPAVEQ